MIYIFDNDALRVLSHYYPDTFKSLWQNIDELIAKGEFLSVRDVLQEIEKKLPALGFMEEWVKNNKHIFVTPTNEETQFIAQIFRAKNGHFQKTMTPEEILRGDPHADPFLVAVAKIRGGTIVTQEKWKSNASKIPNICQHFDIPCMNTEEFLKQQGWTF
jgi:hypothetical protein